MIFLIAASSALSIGLVVALLANRMTVPNRAVKARMAELEMDGLFSADAAARRARERSRFQDLLQYLGEGLERRGGEWSRLRRKLIWAGYREPRAVPIFLGMRFGATGILGIYGLLMGEAAEMTAGYILFTAAFGLFTGWFLPGFLLSMRVTRRQKEIQRALPDAVDLLVICVEAGLGLNQALVRVAQEIRHVSRIMTAELSLTNMAIRAGTPRDQALMDLSERTGVPDIRSLATMVIQTERFGTSIAHSLRVHAETMRTKRRQRAEEAAAKTTIKMIFPLAICIFPALFVVILGPAIISIVQTLSQMN
ncbi:MAG TPA: type II secretion system F family protein [Longimicrobiales bacterium]|nr:type II secretion system F family protein [Longimicrobiales bacterium]